LFDHRITLSALAKTFGGNRQADLLGRLQIDHELEFGRLFDGNVCRLVPFRILSTIDAVRLKGSNSSAPYDIKPPLSTKSRSNRYLLSAIN
jgi:hypothetical protein